MYPHERSLVKKYANKPFTIIGVNSDSNRDKLKKILVKKNLTWRSFWNGGSTSGPIAAAWNVRAWPTIYVIDAEGKIRFKNVRGEALDKAIETLMAELENKKSDSQEQETVDSIIKDFDKGMADWRAAYAKANTAAEKREAMKAYPKAEKYRKRVWAQVDRTPKSDEAGKGLVWIIQRRARTEEQEKALLLLTKHHIDRPDLDKVCKRLRYEFTSYAEKFLRTVHEKNANKGIALYCVAKLLQRRAAFSDSMKTAPNPKKYEEKYLGQHGSETVALLKRCNSASLRDEAEKLLETVKEQFPNSVYREATFARNAVLLGDKVKTELFEIRNLSVGMVAPNIKGEDIDGVKFSLSDYRGKIVLLDFWGDW